MSDTPKFTVVDRRKFRAEEETGTTTSEPALPAKTVPESRAEPSRPPEQPAAPRLTLVESAQSSTARAEAVPQAVALAEEPETEEIYDESQLPPAPTREESQFQKAAYDNAAERLDNLVRAQNPGAPAQVKVDFEHLVQQLYLSAMMQMGAGTAEGQRPRIDILGARQTIDLLDVVLEKSQGNLSPDETRAIETVLFELRLTFLELTRMIATQPPMPPPPGAGNPGARR